VDKVKALCRKVGTNQPLDTLLLRLNPVLRGWCAHFRPGVSSATVWSISELQDLLPLVEPAPRRLPPGCQPRQAARLPGAPPPPHRPFGHPQLRRDLRGRHPLLESLHRRQPDLLPAAAALGGHHELKTCGASVRVLEKIGRRLADPYCDEDGQRDIYRR
jgi:hypothetical protein